MIEDALKDFDARLKQDFESKYVKQVDSKILDEFNDSK